MKLSQLKHSDDPPCYTCVENSSKNKIGRFSQRYVPNKTVPIYANLKDKQLCHVQVLDVYISKLPKDAIARIFLRQTSSKNTHQDFPWFTSTPIGRNELNKMVPNLCQEAGISGQKTNHSLRATGASQLFQVNAPEKIIQERTGRRSTNALYKRTAEEQHMAVTKVLSSNLDVSYMSVLQQCKAVENPANPALANLGMRTLHFSSKM